MTAFRSGLLLVWYVLGCLLAVFTYLYALDSQHIPKNGDEYPYEHITRLTAASGELLPLKSQLDNMRNTKPPLLFWQGIASTNWGRSWTLWNLRYPSVIYTLLTALLLFMLGRRVSGNPETGFVASLTFLAFFTTYRFGRPFLTNAPEVFWVFLPFFVLLHWQKAFASRWLVPILLGLFSGVAFLYKSFALALPVTLGLSGWYLNQRRYDLAAFFKHDLPKVAIAILVAVSLFSMWFVLDPDPQAVWDEFVIGENAGKFDTPGPGYLEKLLWGGSSIWSYAAAFLTNPGVMTFPVVALLFVAYGRRRQLSNEERLLWIWVAAMFLSFALPSQRSGRYLLAAMPAVALLCAFSWHQISRKAFIASLLLSGACVAVFAYLAARLAVGLPGVHLYSLTFWSLITGSVILVVLAIAVPWLTRPMANIAALLVLLCLAALLRPFDGEQGNFSAGARHFAAGKEVGVPCNFRAMDEGYRFLLPGAEVRGYNADQKFTVEELSKRYPLFAVQLPLNGAAADSGCATCKVVGQRFDIRGRQSASELKEILLEGKVFRYLFVREELMESPPGVKVTPNLAPAQACR